MVAQDLEIDRFEYTVDEPEEPSDYKESDDCRDGDEKPRDELPLKGGAYRVGHIRYSASGTMRRRVVMSPVLFIDVPPAYLPSCSATSSGISKLAYTFWMSSFSSRASIILIICSAAF